MIMWRCDRYLVYHISSGDWLHWTCFLIGAADIGPSLMPFPCDETQLSTQTACLNSPTNNCCVYIKYHKHSFEWRTDRLPTQHRLRLDSDWTIKYQHKPTDGEMNDPVALQSNSTEHDAGTHACLVEWHGLQHLV